MEQFSAEYPEIRAFTNERLDKYTYTKTGGVADLLVFPKNRQEVEATLQYVNDKGLPLTVLGNASNLIVKDGGIRGLVMMLTDMVTVEVDQTRIHAAAGAPLIEVAKFAREKHLTGLEFACGIPGSIGGAVFMNAGAYGGEVKDVIESVQVITRQGDFKVYDNQSCDFSYRHSHFQSSDEIVLSVTFQLKAGDLSEISNEMDRLTDLRTSKQPLEYPSCGSVFKRPEGYYTGKLIQDAGLQGYRIGGAEISRKHAGFIVNVDHATATDYLQMIEHIQATIWQLNHVQLETEVRIIGEDQ